VNLEIRKGETLGLVGETGCGKSVTALSIMRLVPDPPGKIVEGEILFKGADLLKKSEEEMRKIRGEEISMVFQDPMTYINPVLAIGDQLVEVIALHQDLNRAALEEDIQALRKRLDESNSPASEGSELRVKIQDLEGLRSNPPKLSKRVLRRVAWRKAVEALRLVRMPDPEKIMSQYPHELSGGMRQRAMIAMMLSCNPDLLLADEPTTALDVTIQAQILELIKELKKEVGASFLLITHDLGIVAETCDRVAVMYAGRVIEEGGVKAVFHNPQHPYTQGLLRAIPKFDKDVERLEIIPGSVPDLINPIGGCRFYPRCPYAEDACARERPDEVEIEPGHRIACRLHSRVRE
jgi:oligopeptide/dipeptide ABC transporter ATP-binding protein